jgi:hypothetical protein
MPTRNDAADASLSVFDLRLDFFVMCELAYMLACPMSDI